MKLGLGGGVDGLSGLFVRLNLSTSEEKTEMVYSENALSAQFRLRALEIQGGKIQTIFKVRSCFL